MEAFVVGNLKNLKNLRVVSFAFISCKSFSRSAVQSFVGSIARNLTNLHELEFDFHQKPASEGFSPGELSTVIDGITANMKVLRKVRLNFFFVIDRSIPYKCEQGVDFHEVMRGYWKKLKYVSTTDIDFGPRHF